MTISEKCTIGGVDYFITLPDSVLLASTGQIYAATTVNFTTNATASGVTRASIEMTHGRITAGGGSDTKVIIGPLIGTETTNSAIWLLGNGTAATSTNVSLYSDSASLILNSISATGIVYIANGYNTNAATFDGNTNTTTLNQTALSLPNIVTSATFSAGGIAPGNITGFIVVKIAGTDRKIPYYAT